MSDTRVGLPPPAFPLAAGQPAATPPAVGQLHGQSVRIVPVDGAPAPDATPAGREPPRLVPGQVRVVAQAAGVEQAQVLREQAAGQFESLQAVTEQMPAQLCELLAQRQSAPGGHGGHDGAPRKVAGATQGAERQAALAQERGGPGLEGGGGAAVALGLRPETVRKHQASDLPVGRHGEVDKDGRGGGGQGGGQGEEERLEQGRDGKGEEGEGEGPPGAQDQGLKAPEPGNNA